MPVAGRPQDDQAGAVAERGDPMPGDAAAAARFLEEERGKWIPILQRTGARAQ